MKKKITFKYPFKVKKWHVFLGIVCAVGFIVSIVVGLNTINEKKEVSAHPSNTITLDEGGTNEFEVPTDAQNLMEPALIDQAPDYNNFVQSGAGYLPILKKGDNVESQWSNPVTQKGTTESRTLTWTIRDVRETDGGNYFVLYYVHGKNVGGVLYVSILNRDGNSIYTKAIGDLTNAIDRSNTLILSSNQGKDFLISTQGNKFYKYSITAESNTSASVTITECSVTNLGTSNMSVAYYRKVSENVDRITYSILAGDIQFDNRNTMNGSNNHLFRVPVGRFTTGSDGSGWTSNPSTFTGRFSLRYSLENAIPTGAENTSGRSYGFLTINEIRIIGDYVIGNFSYSEGTNNVNSGLKMSTVEIFNINDFRVENEKNLLRLKKRYQNSSVNREIKILTELCTDEYVYFFTKEKDNSFVKRIRLGGDYTVEIIKTYPENTLLNFVKNPANPDQIYYFGYSRSLTDELYHPVLSHRLSGSYYYIQGITDLNFNRQSLYAFTMDRSIDPLFMKPGNNRALIFGSTFGSNTNFIDRQYRFNQNLTRTRADATDPSYVHAFTGTVVPEEDYPPIIKKSNNIEVNIDDSSLESTSTNEFGWTNLDNWLITGSKSGNMNSTNAMSVYDYQDSNNASLGQDWLEKRINRNPKNETSPINWEKLGYKKDQVGPHLTTYFITDSEFQVTSNSRIVNNVTSQTIKNNKYALDAQNFHIPLTGIGTAIPEATAVEKFKELAKTMAWNMDDGVVDEDGTDSSKLSDKVTVDALQLKALREAEVAKPYPVDVTYEPEDGVSITNRVWVFVTTKNTLPNNESIYPEVTPDETNGIVYYADDYSIPFRNRRTHDPDNVLDMGNVRVYDYYDSSHEDSGELPALADARNNINRDQLQVINLGNIHMASEPGIIRFDPLNPHTAIIRYEWDGDVNGYHQSGEDHPTYGGLDVTLTGDVLLHVRQVILDDSEKLTIPTEGYLNLKSYDGGEHGENYVEMPSETRQVKIPSERTEVTPTFETFVVGLNHMTHERDQLSFALAIPEFYEIVGNYLTVPAAGADPNGADHQNRNEDNIFITELNFQRNQLIWEEEYFITIYLKPRLPERGPQPYSWDYKVNDFGVIQTE
ncbi:hypothetical protein [Enterococcus sp. DIV0756]|uniref:hypothetical protein n=1 Tax=Enterococcus sp. DIV0756 TaxID=2774636 RepID=UPI003F226AEF